MEFQGGSPVPVKGCRLLRRLGEDHDRAVAAGRRLQAAAEDPGPLGEATSRFLKTWREEIIPHFRKEEEVLLPDLAQKISEGDAVIMLTLTDHIVLRRLVRAVERSTDDRRRSASSLR